MRNFRFSVGPGAPQVAQARGGTFPGSVIGTAVVTSVELVSGRSPLGFEAAGSGRGRRCPARFTAATAVASPG